MSDMSVGIQWSFAFSRSAPVITARTPGSASAAVESMPLIVACAYGLRTIAIQTWLGRLTSSMYWPWPRMKRGSSRRLTECPIPPTSNVVVVGCTSFALIDIAASYAVSAAAGAADEWSVPAASSIALTMFT